MRASESLEGSLLGGRGQRQGKALGGARYNLHELQGEGDELCTAIKKKFLVNEERCEGRNKEQGGSGSSNRSL